MNMENNTTLRVVGETEETETSVTGEEVKKALKNMKNGKSVWPDNAPAEVWKCFGQNGDELLADWFKKVITLGRM